MRTYLDCIVCFVRQGLDAARLVSDDEQLHERVVRRVLRMAAVVDMQQAPPVMGRQIHNLIKQVIGNDDPYREIKQKFNELALKWYPQLHEQVVQSDDAVAKAIGFAIAGNIIDFGVSSVLGDNAITEAIELVEHHKFPPEDIEAFKRDVTKASKILYLADNAGEIVFDKLLLEQLQLLCKGEVVVAVKGKPIINDATMQDAKLVGVAEMVKVIDNGFDAPGTVLAECSEEFCRYFDEADVVIAKGQGNYETLSDVDKHIIFLLKAKCPVVARDIGCEIGDMILRTKTAGKIQA